MGRKAWFCEIDSIDPIIVKNEWKSKCAQDQEKQKHYTLELIQKESPLEMQKMMSDQIAFDKLVDETAHYNESPISFDEYQYEWREINQSSREKVLEEILNVHRKWEPAIAVKFQRKTIIGGWVAT